MNILQHWVIALMPEGKMRETLKHVYMKIWQQDRDLNHNLPFRSTRCGEDVAAGAPTELGTASDNAGDA
jgi:hypothetical protein